MRKDLNKLLCERERRGSGRRFAERRHAKKFAVRDPEDTRAREGMKLRYVYDDKSFNENLRPLYGQVRKAVGRPYAKFYSELSETFDKRSVINQHILTHLSDYLLTGVYVGADGRLYEPRPYGGVERPISESSSEFYVDPRDGIIKRNRHRRTYRQRSRERDARERAERDSRFRQLPDGSVLHRIEETWFHFTLRDAPEGRIVYEKPAGKELFKLRYESVARPWARLRDYERRQCGVERFVGEKARDLFTGDFVYTEPGKPPVRYHATKRTASHRLLKQFGLAQ